jgi:hypothetical protein
MCVRRAPGGWLSRTLNTFRCVYVEIKALLTVALGIHFLWRSYDDGVEDFVVAMCNVTVHRWRESGHVIELYFAQ